MSDFTDMYKELVILQYYSKEKAQAEIKLWSDEFENVYSFLNQFFTEFDLDQATGDRLDKIGKIVGQSRIVEGGVTKNFFGYQGASNALAYGAGRYFVEGDDLYTDSELTDGQYRAFIKAKVSKNNASAIITGNGRDGLQDAIQLLFNGSGYVYDNQDMSLNLYIDDTFPTDDLILIIKANLLPKPQAVRYRWYVQIPDCNSISSQFYNSFGFNGIDKAIDVNDSLSLRAVNDAITVNAWVNLDNTTGGFRAVLTKDTQAVSDREYTLYMFNGQVRFQAVDGTNAYTVISTVNLNSGQWYMLTGRCTGQNGDVEIYINGVLDNSIPFSTTNPINLNNTNISIGYSVAGNDQHFNGSITSVFVSQAAISPSDISTIYNNGKLLYYDDLPSSVTSDLGGYWEMTSRDNTLNDLTGNNNNGTGQGGVTSDGELIEIEYIRCPFGYAGAPNAAGYGSGEYAQILTIP